jgi:hypothetical protein
MCSRQMTTGRHQGQCLDLLGEQPRTKTFRNKSCGLGTSVAQPEFVKSFDQRRESHRETTEDSEAQESRGSLSDAEIGDCPAARLTKPLAGIRDRASETALMHAPFGAKEVAQVAALRAVARRGDPAVVRILSLPCTLKNASAALCGYPA